MAATRLIALHIGKGKNLAKALNARLDYSQNPDKTDGGELISSYECSPETAAEEFLLSKKKYYELTGRTQQKDVIAYQIRQAFKPGEITPEEANKVGYELTMRFTKGRHAFTVSTHIDKAHIHNHIIFNSTSLDCTRKFRDFKRTGLALQRVSDIVCLEHRLSVIIRGIDQTIRREKYQKRITIRDQIRKDIDEILEKSPQTMEEFLAELQSKGYEIRKGKYISVRGKDQKRFVRLKSLGKGYSEEELLQPVIAPVIGIRKKQKFIQLNRFDLLINIPEKLRQGKGAGYERWAKTFNIKQTAEVLLFLQENDIHTYEDLKQKTEEAVKDFNRIQEAVKEKEQRLAEISELKSAVIDYHRTREIFSEYKASRYSEKYLEEHREEITLYRAAQAVFHKYRIEKFPKVKELSQEFAQVLSEKRELYSGYSTAKKRMQEFLKAQKNVETILEIKEEKTARQQEENSEKPAPGM